MVDYLEHVQKMPYMQRTSTLISNKSSSLFLVPDGTWAVAFWTSYITLGQKVLDFSDVARS